MGNTCFENDLSKQFDCIDDYEEKAKELFKEGYNCAQSVFGAYCEDMNLELQTALK